MMHIIVIILILISLASLLWVRQLPEIEETESNTKFTVSYPSNIGKVIFYGAYALLAMGLVGLIIRFGEDGVEIFLFVFSLAAFVWLLAFAFFLRGLEVDQESLKYRTFYGKTKEIQASELDKIVQTDQSSLILYANGKKFGALSREFLHIDNFLSYCGFRGIVLQFKEGKPLTKTRLYVGAMRGTGLPQVTIGICVFAVLVCSILAMMPDYRFLALVLGIVIIVTIPPIMFIIGSLLVSPEISRIVAQERFFGVNFREEMQKQQITTTEHISKEWFIKLDGSHIFVFRRGYIVEIEQMDWIDPGVIIDLEAKIFGTPPIEPILFGLTAITVDGRRIRLRGQQRILVKLKDWLEEEVDYGSV